MLIVFCAHSHQRTILRTSVSVVVSFLAAWLPFAATALVVHFRLLRLSPALLTVLEVSLRGGGSLWSLRWRSEGERIFA